MLSSSPKISRKMSAFKIWLNSIVGVNEINIQLGCNAEILDF